MSLERSDAWHPIQGGWESFPAGMLIPVDAFVEVLSRLSGNDLSDHDDYEHAADEADVLSFLEDQCEALGLPAPEQVIQVKANFKGTKGLPPTLPPSLYALWPQSIWDASPNLQAALVDQGVATGAFQYRYPRRLAVVADLVLWLAIGVIGFTLVARCSG